MNTYFTLNNIINSLRLSDAYERQWNKPSLVQIMACRLFGAKPLSEPVLTCCQLEPKEFYLVKFWSKIKHFHSRQCVSISRLQNVRHIFSASMCSHIEHSDKCEFHNELLLRGLDKGIYLIPGSRVHTLMRLQISTGCYPSSKALTLRV